MTKKNTKKNRKGIKVAVKYPNGVINHKVEKLCGRKCRVLHAVYLLCKITFGQLFLMHEGWVGSVIGWRMGGS